MRMNARLRLSLWAALSCIVGCSSAGDGESRGGGGEAGHGDGGPVGGGGGSGGGGSGSAEPPTTVVQGNERSGEGTYYGADGTGACSFDPSPEDMNVAALNKPDWAGSALCGACADVQGPSGTVRIRVVDQCPECRSGDLDFSQQAFARIAALSAGRVSIHWKLVACDVTGPVRYRYKDGSNAWWTAVQVTNHRLPVTKLEFSTDSGASWKSTQRTNYNYFLADGGFGSTPVTVRITAQDGQTLVDSLPAVQELLVTTGQAQFR